jgi:hypothetical protein
MSKFIFQLRRGTRYVDDNGVTELDANGAPVRDDWATYTAQEDHLDPLDGELVLEFEYNRKTGKKTPRLKIGDGENVFADLEYISVDSFVLPTPTTINLYGGESHWDRVDGFENRYVQDITDQLTGKVTVNSKIDLQPTPEQLYRFHSKEVSFTTVNEDGNIRVCAIGVRPEENYENIQVTITEVVTNV